MKLYLLLFISILIGASTLVVSDTIHASGHEITLVSQSAVSDFPNGVKFFIDAASPDEIDEIRALHYQMAAHHKRGELSEYFAANQQIHGKIMAATGNATLGEIYASLAGRIRMARYRANFSQTRWDQAMAEHEEILAALAERNGPRLTKVLRIHLENTCETVKAVIGAGETDQ